ncbi:MAG TPA: glycoside hydrolase family 36 protein, partial [Myxococcales bacterium]|nr:glycoside hydrolase family 36 protein [Myxococcales bacterium]
MTRLPGEVLDLDGRRAEHVRIDLAEERHGEDTLWHPELVNEGPEVRASFACPLVLELKTGEPPERIRFLVNGYSSFSGSGSFHLGETEIDSRIPWLRPVHRNLHLPRQRQPGHLTSSLFGVIAIPGEDPLTVGFLPPQDHFAQVRVHPERGAVRLWAQLQFEGQRIPSGARLKLPSLFVGRGRGALDRYAQRLSREPRPVPAGWCTWYHYYTRIDEAECHRNLDHARRLPWPVKLFQLDDGYQRELGDWLDTNEKFPSGLAALARKAREAGLVPGLWVAPFIARLGSRLAREHPRWLLRDRRGRRVVALWNPMWGPLSFAYAMDATHPELLEHLRTVFTALREQGFGFFKLDFLYAAALPGAYHDPGLTSLRALREGLRIIREAVGDAYILGCGCPLEAGAGLVDSMRVGNDVTPYWSGLVDRFIGRGFEQLSTRNCIRNTLVRAPFNLRLFHGDPDCLITTGLSPAEQRTLAQVAALSGGTLMISDDLGELDGARRDVLDFAFRLSAEVRAVPRAYSAPDVMEQRLPELQLALGPDDAYLGVYNFGDHPASKSIRVSDFIPWPGVKDIQTDEIEPHGCRLFHLVRPP